MSDNKLVEGFDSVNLEDEEVLEKSLARILFSLIFCVLMCNRLLAEELKADSSSIRTEDTQKKAMLRTIQKKKIKML